MQYLMKLTDLQLEIQKLWADKSLSLGSLFHDKKYGLCMITKYVRTGSSSSEWYDWVSCKWKLVFSDYREWELRFVILRTRENLVMRVDEKIEMINDENIKDTFEIIWHPITRWRLCYLRQTNKSDDTIVDWVKQKMEKWISLSFAFEDNPELYQKSILEWDEQTQNKVRDFLLSIQ